MGKFLGEVQNKYEARLIFKTYPIIEGMKEGKMYKDDNGLIYKATRDRLVPLPPN